MRTSGTSDLRAFVAVAEHGNFSIRNPAQIRAHASHQTASLFDHRVGAAALTTRQIISGFLPQERGIPMIRI